MIASNCLIAGNTASGGRGGGLYNSSAVNCTIISNVASGGGLGYGGGIWGGNATNCIVYHNTALGEANCTTSSILSWCCTTPTNAFPGPGLIDAAPLFRNVAAGNYRLRPPSPGVNAGTNLAARLFQPILALQ